jgi:hypothetical protein
VAELEAAIRNALDPLVGLRLAAATTTGNLRSFCFGALRRDSDGQLIGDFVDFALRVSWPWRIEGAGMIVVGSGDYHDRASDNEDPKWPPGKPWGTRQSELIEILLGGNDPETHVIVDTTDRLVVEAITPDRIGGASLFLSGGFKLVAFPSSTRDIDWILDPPGDHAGCMVQGADFITIPRDPKPRSGG